MDLVTPEFRGGAAVPPGDPAGQPFDTDDSRLGNPSRGRRKSCERDPVANYVSGGPAFYRSRSDGLLLEPPPSGHANPVILCHTHSSPFPLTFQSTGNLTIVLVNNKTDIQECHSR